MLSDRHASCCFGKVEKRTDTDMAGAGPLISNFLSGRVSKNENNFQSVLLPTDSQALG